MIVAHLLIEPAVEFEPRAPVAAQQLQARVKKRNAELFSLRCDAEIKLRIAEEFRTHEFYFPYNLDFRGRCGCARARRVVSCVIRDPPPPLIHIYTNTARTPSRPT